jgi:hypothetical protein
MVDVRLYSLVFYLCVNIGTLFTVLRSQPVTGSPWHVIWHVASGSIRHTLGEDLHNKTGICCLLKYPLKTPFKANL